MRAAPERVLLLLGWLHDTRIVLIDMPVSESLELPANTAFQELRPLAPVLGAQEAALLAYARALGTWRARQLHCGVCGSPTEPTHAGHCLRCSNPACAQEFFPRIDPAIIVLVSDGERALLGRSPSWPPRRYSTIAGFVEPGESLEDTVLREVLEETGVAVHNVRYHSSQPWPFPSSLMLGFFASAAPGSAVRVGGELEDARWFTRAQVISGRGAGAALAVDLLAPHRVLAERRGVAHDVPAGPRLAGAPALSAGGGRQPRRVPRAPGGRAGALARAAGDPRRP